jgi:hypothetical protein
VISQQPAERGSLVRLVASQVGSVVAVTAVLALTFAWLGPDDRRASVGSARSSASASPESTAAASTSTTATVSSTPSPTAVSPGVPAPMASPSVPKAPPVVVLNQSRRSGLAGRVAVKLRAAGWTVERTGDFAGNVSTTTVYYPTGLVAAARRLAADLPGSPRVKQRFSSLPRNRLTVIVTSDYPG